MPRAPTLQCVATQFSAVDHLDDMPSVGYLWGAMAGGMDDDFQVR